MVNSNPDYAAQAIPIFPSFTSLQAYHQSEISQLLRGHHPYSDYNFISLWSWDHENKLELSKLNNNLVIKFQDYTDPNDFFYSFFGLNLVDQTAKSLLDFSIGKGIPKLRLIAEVVINNIKQPAMFVAEEDRDSFDYIIATKIASESYGRNSHRRSLKKFVSAYGDNMKVTELDINHPQTAQQLMAVFENWEKHAAGGTHYNPGEKAALKKLLASQADSLDTANLHVLGIYLGGQLSAFSVSEILDNGFAMGHFAKTDKSYKGLSTALDNFTAKSLMAKGVTHLNYEQDVGVEGLRQSKMLKKPVFFLKKYTLALK